MPAAGTVARPLIEFDRTRLRVAILEAKWGDLLDRVILMVPAFAVGGIAATEGWGWFPLLLLPLMATTAFVHAAKDRAFAELRYQQGRLDCLEELQRELTARERRAATVRGMAPKQAASL